MKVRELLKDAGCWTKGVFALNAAGDEVSAYAQQATCFCLEGAIMKCYPPGIKRIEVIRCVEQKVGYNNIPAWNDREVTTFTDVRKLIEELDI